MKKAEIKLLGLLAKGGQANLYVGRFSGRLVAFKRFLPPWDDSQEFLSLQKLRHLIIPRIIGRSLNLDYPGLVLEYFPGSTLRLVLNYLADSQKSLSPAALSYINFSLFEALEYIHSQGVIHNDLSPSNILLTQDGSLRICDFGSSFLLSQNYTGVPFGKKEYMAPELLRGEKPSKRSDFYSLASIISELSRPRAAISTTYPYIWIKQARFSWRIFRPKKVPQILLAPEIARKGRAELKNLSALAPMLIEDAGEIRNKKIKFCLF